MTIAAILLLVAQLTCLAFDLLKPSQASRRASHEDKPLTQPNTEPIPASGPQNDLKDGHVSLLTVDPEGQTLEMPTK